MSFRGKRAEAFDVCIERKVIDCAEEGKERERRKKVIEEM